MRADWRRRWRGGHLLGMRVATALAALLLAAGLVIRMSAPLTSSSPTARRTITSNGLLELGTDREAPLFDGVMLSPGRPVSACAHLTVTSPDDPAAITLALRGFEGSRTLADATEMTVEYGSQPAADADCAGFVPEAQVATGTLGHLAEQGGGDRSVWQTSDPLPGSSDVWFRVTLLLPVQAASEVAGHEVERFDLVWATSIVPPSETDLRGQVLLVLGGVAEHAVLPLLMMLVIAVLFLGVQNRIDRRDPKLAAAPVVRGSLEFAPRER